MRFRLLMKARAFSILALFAGAAVVVHTNSAYAELRTYNIDSSLSSLTAGGQLYGKPYNQQAAGSLTTNYTGSIKLEVNPGSIQFAGGSIIDANTSGDWTPANGSGTGFAAADYGAFTNDTTSGQPVTIYLASRGLIADLTSSAMPVSGGNFSASGITFGFTQGSTDFTVILNATQASVQHGNSNLVNRSAGNVGGTGQVANVGLMQILTLPINVSIPIDGDGNGSFESIFALTGTLVAKASLAHPGDFDSDGDVDGADFVAWQTHFPTASGATLAFGDADADGDIDGADFVVWQTNFPYSPGPGTSPVPEPGSICLALVSLLYAGTWRSLYASRTAARGR